jgi:hypothetical protein
MPSHEQLEKFLAKHVQSQISAEEVIQLAEDAFKRAAADRPSRAELKIKAENLEKASRQITKALYSVGDLHFFLRMANTLTTQGLESDVAPHHGLEEARAFDDKTKLVFSNLKSIQTAFLAIAEACKTLTDSKRPLPVFSREGRAANEEGKQLGLELAALWHLATGKVPAASGSASFDKPGTQFGRFVALAAVTFENTNIGGKGFAGFLRRAFSDYRRSPLFGGATGGDTDGVKTPKTS